jgi:CheY-like chemotaxis protein
MDRIKQQHPHLTCIAISDVKADAGTAAEKGADGFLCKPFEINDLFDIVQHYVVEAR